MYTITIERLVTMKHTICYAYPTSDLAEKVGKHGYVVNDAHQFDLYEDALSYAQSLGTEPDRMSIDHPANHTFLRSAEQLRVHHSRNKVLA
jgi:hypothetical protein